MAFPGVPASFRKVRFEDRPPPVLTVDYLVGGRALSVFTTSAKTGDNVESAFLALAGAIVGHRHEDGVVRRPRGLLHVLDQDARRHLLEMGERQAEEVDKVKRSANGIIVDPVTLPPDATVARAREVMDQHNISGVPITTEGRRLAGIITRRDLRFLDSGDTPIADIMTASGLVTATGAVSLDEAERILPLIDKRQFVGATQHLNVGDVNFDLAGRHLSVFGAGGGLADFAIEANNPFRA
mgnify:CR=1 FL=1